MPKFKVRIRYSGVATYIVDGAVDADAAEDTAMRRFHDSEEEDTDGTE